MRDELSKSLGVDKALLGSLDDIAIAKLYCLKYVVDPGSYRTLLEKINKIGFDKEKKLGIEEYLDTRIYNEDYLAGANLARRFNDLERGEYLDNKSDPLLDDALKTIRDRQPHIAKKIQTTLKNINDLKINKILDGILAYNSLSLPVYEVDINGKINEMLNANKDISVEKKDYDALLVLGLDLPGVLKGKFFMKRSTAQRPSQFERPYEPASSGAAGAAGAAKEPKTKYDSLGAIKEIAACIGVELEGNEGELLEEFVGKILEGRGKIFEGRYKINDGSQEAYDKALDVLRKDINCQLVVDLLGQSVHSEAGAAGPVTNSRAPLFGVEKAPHSPQPKTPPIDEIKKRISGYVTVLKEVDVRGDKNFRDGLIEFLNKAKKGKIDEDPQLLKRLDLFFKSVDSIGGGDIFLASATESKNIDNEYVLEKDGKKVNLRVDCIESRLMHKACDKSFNYVIGARDINLQTEVQGNFVLVNCGKEPDNESYAPYAVPDDNNFLKDDTQKNLYKLNLLDGISKMAYAIKKDKTDIRVTCVEGKGRSVTLALLFAKICKGDFSFNEERDEALIKKLARDRNSNYIYVTSGLNKPDDYQNSPKFKMLTEVLEEFQERLKGKGDDSKFFENVTKVADSIRRSIVIERNIAKQYRNQISPVEIGV